MNFRQSLVLSVATIAFAAPALSFAAGLQQTSGEAATAITFNTAASTLTRAQVQQDLKAARMNGSIPVSPEGASSFAPASAGMSKTRAQVSSELASSTTNLRANAVL